MRRWCSLLLFCSSLVTTPAFAGVLTFLNSPGVPADTVNWAQLGGDGTLINQSFNATSGGGVGVAGLLTGAGGGLLSVVCATVNPVNCSWGPPTTGYAPGNTLLWAEDTNFQGSSPISLTLSIAQFGVGAYMQSASSGQFNGTLAVFAGVNLLGSHTYTSNANGDALFLGVSDTAKEITKVVFSSSLCGSFLCDATDFSMNKLDIYGAPEPSATLLMASALLMLGGMIRKGTEQRRRQ